MRAVSPIFGTLLMMLITLLAVTEAVLVGYPLLNKRIEAYEVTKLQNILQNIRDEIVELSNTGGTIRIYLPGFSKLQGVNARIEKDATGDYAVIFSFKTSRPYFSSSFFPVDEDLELFSGSEKIKGTVPYTSLVTVAARSVKIGATYITEMGIFSRPVYYTSTGMEVKVVFTPLEGMQTRCVLPCRLVIKKLGESTSSSVKEILLGVGFE